MRGLSALHEKGILFFLFIAMLVSDIDGKAEEKIIPYSFRSIKSFTKSLILDKDYYRAKNELERARAYYPNLLSDKEYYNTLLYICFQSGKYQQIHKLFDEIEEPEIKTHARLYLIDSMLMTGDINSSCNFFRDHRDNDTNLDSMFLKRKFLIDLLGDSCKRDLKYAHDAVGSDLYYELKKSAEEYKQREKNYSSAVLCGLFPGGGYMYAGQAPTGFVALTVVTLTAVLSYAAFQTGNDALGIFIGTGCTFFYTGSIIGGYMATGRYNSSLHKRAREEFIQKLGIASDHEQLYNTSGIGN